MDDVDHHCYAAFLPAEYTSDMVEPTSTWWPWRDTSVHIARAPAPAAAVRAMVIHGGGGYSGALWPAASAANAGSAELLAPDLPLYGDTKVPEPVAVRYVDWVELLCDLVRAEQVADRRPLILFGASMGGMLAYEVAARTRLVDAVVVTCLLDMSDPSARAAATRFAWMGRPAPTLLRALDRVVGRVGVPIRWVADMSHMSSNPRLSRLCALDPRGGGVSVPLSFLSDWMNYTHTPPEDYAAAPVTLVAPAADRWTPPELSIKFLQRISAPTATVMLENCGHFPIEEPGLGQLRDTLLAVLTEVSRRAS